MSQAEFHSPKMGGKRPGAGRKPKGERALVSHLARPKFEKVTPAHVTLRVGNDIPNLRASKRFAKIREAFARAREREGLRIVEFSVLGTHLHLIVEADSSVELSRGMQSLCTRLARQLNKLLARAGRLFADHYHARLLRSPTELARAIHYVLTNAAHHFGLAGSNDESRTSLANREVTSAARGWLLSIGWARAAAGRGGTPAGLPPIPGAT